MDSTAFRQGSAKMKGQLKGVSTEFSQVSYSAGRMNTMAKKAFTETRTPLERHKASVAKLNTVYAGTNMSVQTYLRSMDRLTDKHNRATASTSKFGNAMKLVATGMATMAAYRIVRGITSQVEAIDKLAKTAEKLGMTTEALSRLQYAGKLTGVETNTLNMAIQRMTRRMSEAAVGTGEAQGAIKELGMDARRLVQLAPDQMFMEVAEAMSHVDNKSDKLRLAFKLFDSEGVALINTLNLGKEGLAEFGAEADKLGVTIDEKTAQKMEALKDSITRIKEAMRGAGIAIADDVAGPIEKTANRMVEAKKEWGAFGDAIERWFKKVSRRTWSYIPIGRDIIKAEEISASLDAEIKRVDAEGLKHLADKAGSTFAADFASAFGKGLRAAFPDTLKGAVGTLGKLGGFAASAGKFAGGSWMAGNKAIADKREGERAERLRVQERNNLAGNRMREQFRTPQEKFDAQKADVDRLRGIGAIGPETHGRAMESFTEQLKRATESGGVRASVGQRDPGPQALVRGTAAERNFRVGLGSGDPVQLAKQQLTQLEKIVAAIEEQPGLDGIDVVSAPL